MDLTAYHHVRVRTRGKRPLRNLTPGDKVRAIQRIHNGETKASVSRDIGVPESTLRGWCKNEQKLRLMSHSFGPTVSDYSAPTNGVNVPPLKRPKLVEALEITHLCSVNRLQTLNSLENKSKWLLQIKQKKDETGIDISKNDKSKQAVNDGSRFQKIPAELSMANDNPMPWLQNIDLLSYFNPNFITRGFNLSQKPCNTKEESIFSSPKKNLSTVDSWTHDVSCLPLQKSLTDSKYIKDLVGGKDSFKCDIESLLLRFKDHGTASVSNSYAYKSNDHLVNWSKIFNASLHFLALATATAAVELTSECSPLTSTINMKYSFHSEAANMEPSHLKSQSILNYPEDGSFECEPTDLSVRSLETEVFSSESIRSQSIA